MSYTFVDKTHQRRLQGKAWQENRHKYRLIGYSESLNGNYCAFLRLKTDTDDTGPIVWHWLSPAEAEKFHTTKHEFPVMKFSKVKKMGKTDKVK